MEKRFFSENSFWNTPIEPNPEIDDRSDRWIGYMKKDPSGNMGINLQQYTIPIYEVDDDVPTIDIHQGRWDLDPDHPFVPSHGPGFGKSVPFPPGFAPSPGTDSHATIVSWSRRKAWDMWAVRQRTDGSWESCTGMVVDLDGPGVFDPKDFAVKEDESIHSYGPSRAAGVPSFAGTIMHEEAMAGEIRHKLSCAMRYVAYKEYTPPAIWTDGALKGGIPEGAVLQLDPALDLSQFDLFPGERAVAVALQRYGAVVVDFAGANVLYGEGLWYDKERSWDGVLRDWGGGICSIPLEHYRFLKIKDMRQGGDMHIPFHANFLNL